jgi:hypothetical protein
MDPSIFVQKILGVERSNEVLLPTSKENDHERKNI